MVHPGCGADIIRQRRRKETLKKEQIKQQSIAQATLDPFEASYAKNNLSQAKNKRYHGHYTPARDSEVFNKRRYIPMYPSSGQKQAVNSQKKSPTVKLYRHNSVQTNKIPSIKHQKGFHSKSLEQEGPPTSSLSADIDISFPTSLKSTETVNASSQENNQSCLTITSSPPRPISSKKSLDSSRICSPPFILWYSCKVDFFIFISPLL